MPTVSQAYEEAYSQGWVHSYRDCGGHWFDRNDNPFVGEEAIAWLDGALDGIKQADKESKLLELMD